MALVIRHVRGMLLWSSLRHWQQGKRTNLLYRTPCRAKENFHAPHYTRTLFLKKHPSAWGMVVKACSLLAEEAGEAVRAANTFDETRTGKKDIVTEAIHTAATAIRLLKNIEETDPNE